MTLLHEEAKCCVHMSQVKAEWSAKCCVPKSRRKRERIELDQLNWKGER
jgi:hypothetical protein